MRFSLKKACDNIYFENTCITKKKKKKLTPPWKKQTIEIAADDMSRVSADSISAEKTEQKQYSNCKQATVISAGPESGVKEKTTVYLICF